MHFGYAKYDSSAQLAVLRLIQYKQLQVLECLEDCLPLDFFVFISRTAVPLSKSNKVSSTIITRSIEAI